MRGKFKAQFPEVKAIAKATAWLPTAPRMLKGRGLETKEPVDPSLGEDPPCCSMSIGLRMRGLDKYIPFPESLLTDRVDLNRLYL